MPGDQKEPSLKEGWHRIHSPNSNFGYLLAGLVGLVVPFVLFSWISVIAVIAERNKVRDANLDTSTPWVIVILALLLFIPMHELIHTILHPRFGFSSQTVMVIWPKKIRFGVYYEGSMTRLRWLMMRIAPLVCLSGPFGTDRTARWP